jgi:uncharacterized membrane protein (UPF0127 family)/CheY-like chemotaxis protein
VPKAGFSVETGASLRGATPAHIRIQETSDLGVEVKLIINFSSGRAVCERTLIADRALRRMKGLMGRRSLERGEGMLLRPAPSIHTAFMRFPIDAVFVDADLRVVEVASLDGDHSDNGHEEDIDRVLAPAFPPNVEVAPAIDRFASDDEQRRLRVLLIAQDRRFRTVASALLARRGCSVATSPNAQHVADLVARERTDVVVLDAGALLTAAARTVATVGAIEPPIGVVLVGDEAETGLQHMPVLAKWGPFEEFFAAIEQADRDRGRRSRLVG